MTRPLTVAVTGLNATDNPAPGVAVIRALREADPDCQIVGLAYDALDPGNYLHDIADHTYLMPYPSAGSTAMWQRLVAIWRRTPFEVIVPTLDAELLAFVRLAPRLSSELGVEVCLPDEVSLGRRAKDQLADLRIDGVAIPKTRVINDPARLDAVGAELGYPFVVKGRFYDAAVARSAAEAHAAFHRISATWGLPIICQAFIPGTEFDVACVGDGRGGALGSVAMRKLQLTDKGKAWGGVTVSDAKLHAATQATLAALWWRGPCELELMRAHADDQLYLIEINPRFPAWIYLSVGADRNLPWLAVQLALGRDVTPLPPADAGVMFLRHSVDQILPMSDYASLTVAGELHRHEVRTA